MNIQAGAGVANANMAAAMSRGYPVAPGAPAAAARAYPQAAAEAELKQIPTEQVQVRQVETTPFFPYLLSV